MMSVAKTMELRISMLAFRTTASAFRRCSTGNATFSRSRRTTFSTSITASSTSAPMAMAMPPSVIVLMVAPNALSVSTAATSESGMAVMVMSVARPLARNTSTTTMTSSTPSPNAVKTFLTATSMKFACRKMSVWSFMPGGSLVWMSASTASSCLVRASVFAPGCF